MRNIVEEYKNGIRDFSGANLQNADLQYANLYVANFTGADLQGAVLRGADLRYANLYEANLTGADLQGAVLRGADLRGANLRSAYLRSANFWGADLQGANLTGADLRYADLRGANLRGAVLRGTGLQGANLQGANLTGANLTGTCLDPSNEMPIFDSSEFEVDSDGFFAAFRTKASKIGGYEYEAGKEYIAPYFSTDSDTECHPGLYFATLEEIQGQFPNEVVIKVKVHISDALKCDDKYRCKRFTVEGVL